MKVLRILAVALVSVVAALIAAVGVAWLLFDPNDYRDTIAEEVQRATGREFGIEGRIRVSMWPRPRLGVADISLANIPGGSRQAFVTIGEVEADIALRPLLRGRLDFTLLRIRGLDVLFETDAEGTGNWEIRIPPPAADDTGTTLPFIETLILEKARIAYRASESGHPCKLTSNGCGYSAVPYSVKTTSLRLDRSTPCRGRRAARSVPSGPAQTMPPCFRCPWPCPWRAQRWKRPGTSIRRWKIRTPRFGFESAEGACGAARRCWCLR